MDDLAVRRGMFRLGVVTTGMAVLVLSLALTAPLGEIPLWWWLALGLLGTTGIGLLLGARFARVLSGLFLLACVVFVPLSLFETLSSSPVVGADLLWLLAIANAVATTLLMTWMCIRGILMLLGRGRRSSAVTARVVGGVFAVVAANHLWLAYLMGFEWTGYWSFNISDEGTRLVGFPFWPVWHVALLVVALAMLAGPRRMLGHAATALLLLFAILMPLMIVAALRTGFIAVQLTIFGMMLIPVYLSWWLRDELRTDARAGAGAGAGADHAT
jgi:hypothetical protein